MRTSISDVECYLAKLANVLTLETTSIPPPYMSDDCYLNVLFSKIASSQFRRSKLTQELERDIRTKINCHFRAGSPISFTIPFGGYKNWRAWSYPHTEWAEVFSVHYVLEYALTIAAMYKPGVTLHYSYGDNVMNIVSNMPQQDTEAYLLGFKQIVGFYQKIVPENVTIDCVRINDFYNSDCEHLAELRSNYEDNLKRWKEKYPSSERDAKLASAMRNLMPNGVENLTQLTAEEWRKRALVSAMWCDAHDSLHLRRTFNKFSGHIQLGNIKGRTLELHIGSCDTSTHQFWVGIGLLENKCGRLLQRIASQDKIDFLLKQRPSRLVKLQVNSEFRRLNKHYESIYIIEDDY
jgi:hypothetical protein